MPTAEMHLVGEARSPSVARRFLIDTLTRWDAAGYADAATLVLSELVTNAALHARTDVTVRINLSVGGLRLEVADGSLRRPIARHHSNQSTTGRGLALVEAFSQTWGVTVGDTGKVVWAELVVDGAMSRINPPTDGAFDLAVFPDLEDRLPAAGAEINGNLGVHGRVQGRGMSATEGRPDTAGLVAIHLLGLPVPIWARSQEWGDDLIREFTLIAINIHDRHQSNAVPVRLIELVEALTGRYGAFSVEQEARLAAAAAAGEAEIDELVFHLPREAGEAATRLAGMLDEVDAYCRAGQHLLSLAPDDELVRFRNWYLDEFIRQIAGQPPRPWPTASVP